MSTHFDKFIVGVLMVVQMVSLAAVVFLCVFWEENICFQFSGSLLIMDLLVRHL